MGDILRDGNVFFQLGFENWEAMTLRSELCSQIDLLVRERGMPWQQAAEIAGTSVIELRDRICRGKRLREVDETKLEAIRAALEGAVAGHVRKA